MSAGIERKSWLPDGGDLIWVKRDLQILHQIYQFLDATKQSLIGHAGPYDTVMVNPAVEFEALVTHRVLPWSHGGIARPRRETWWRANRS
jgi:hypothetical protein